MVLYKVNQVILNLGWKKKEWFVISGKKKPGWYLLSLMQLVKIFKIDQNRQIVNT